MPNGLPSAIRLTRYEWVIDLDRKDDDGDYPATILPEGLIVLPQFQLSDIDGWIDGEWLIKDQKGRRFAILGEKLRLSVLS